jgi:hypothetical protein
MSSQDPIPGPDQAFDTLQGILVAAVILKAIDWDIPADVVTELTDAQTPWTTTWAIAKNKQNSTQQEREAKDDARIAYTLVLRPFIQKWIYLNKSMSNADVEYCGLKPRDNTRTPATLAEQPVASVKRGIANQLLPSCNKIDGANYYGCIMVIGAALPEGTFLSADGKLVFEGNAGPTPKIVFDLNQQREKKFSGLQHDETYYFYFYAVNSAGVSPLSEGISIVCW